MDFPNTPPRGKDARDMRSTMAQMLEELLLADPDLPEDAKLRVQIISTARKFSHKLHEVVSGITMDIRPGSGEGELKKGREFLEYLQLMEAGFDQFVSIQKENT